MTCIQCNGQTAPGHTSMTLERDGTTLVVQSAPAEVCTACGEAYLSADTTDRLTAHGRLISLKIFKEQEFARLQGLGTPFARRVAAEGQPLG